MPRGSIFLIELGWADGASQEAADGMYLRLEGRVFLEHVNPMKSCGKQDRLGWAALLTDSAAWARRAQEFAQTLLADDKSRSA